MNLLTRAEAPFLIAATAVYLVAMLLLWVQLFFWPRENEVHKRTPGDFGSILLWIGATLHLAALAGQGPTLFMMKAGVVGLFGWLLIVSFLMVGQKIGNSSGAVVAPIALICALYSLAAPQLHSWTPSGRLDAVWSAAHIFLILSGYAALAFAFAASLLYLVQENLLKRRKLTGLWQKLPALHVADEWIYRATAFGLALLTLGLLTAIAFSWLKNPNYAAWRDPKVLFSGATWAIFTLYLVTRAKLGWHGRKSNMVVIYGFVVMAISVFGVQHLGITATP
ncbi:ABC-type uncharacterized transport system, permease component [Abditibacterium utsteinense]|uniref:ABC-type uncharacterized transport system, permease component n=1 Tax=Abditibacterium utsteinense TaxID=1960156 RepID=A0A2S8SRN9_9BACT|nr:cytochrome c biogenesis protein CcsA [Abditibacterium utsteinense]PQV63482.1 ABC-type uncharacterized transport system, permease component [Abditibacterium utsteinense]